jgi:hypothetical protein
MTIIRSMEDRTKAKQRIKVFDWEGLSRLAGWAGQRTINEISFREAPPVVVAYFIIKTKEESATRQDRDFLHPKDGQPPDVQRFYDYGGRMGNR